MSKAKILIVEDENIVALDLKNRLNKLGFEITAVACSGEQAIRAVKRRRPDLVLMDIMLKGSLDGIETAKQIRKRLDIPIVFLTAYADPETIERAKFAKPFGYILKPFEERELQITLKMALYKHNVDHQIQQNERWLKTILNSIHEAVIVADLDARVAFLNPNAEKLTGWNYHEAVGLRICKVFALVRAQKEGNHQSGQPYFNDMDHLTELNGPGILTSKNGNSYLIENHVSPIQDEKGEVTGSVIVFRDISDRRRLEKALVQIAQGVSSFTGEAFFRSLVTYLAKVLDAKYAFVGKLVGKAIGKIETLAFCEDGEIAENFNYNLAGTPCEKVAGKSLLVCPGGAQKEFPEDNLLAEMNIESYIGAPLFSSSGDPLGIMVVLDTKPLKNPELAKSMLKIFASRAEAEMERQVTEEEKKRLEAQILHTQKLESLGVIAGGIAHDFNNLLVGILSNASLALKELPDSLPAKQIIRQIEEASQRAAELTRQLLAYSGKGKVANEPIDLSGLSTNMAALLKISMSKKVQLQFDCKAELPWIEGDPAQIRQVLMTLITNASEAIGDECGVITLRTGLIDADQAFFAEAYLKEDLPDGRYVFLEVSDTGCGMDPETISKVFDPFFSSKFAGRGLGLAAVLGIIRAHRGAIKVHSKPDQGSTFTIYFPAKEGLVKAKKIPDNGGQEEWKGSGKILVVDDERMVRTVSKRILEHYGFDVLTAKNGQEGVQLYQRQANDILLVLLDMTMPDMNGVATFRELQKIRQDVRVILFSGYNKDEALSQITGKGLADFIQKPFKPDELMRKIRKAL